MCMCAKRIQKQRLSFKNNITVECTWWKEKQELERVGVAAGGRIGGLRPILLLFFPQGWRGGVTDICLGNISRIGSHYWKRGACWCAVYASMKGTAVAGGGHCRGFRQTQKFVAIHAFIMESNEARKCPPVYGNTRQTSLTRTHAESRLACSWCE